jgi:glycosyltransferase involved in cell wall biosynthesis
MKNVLIINQSSELYGSDKALLELLENFPKNCKPIVVLEGDGILNDVLKKKGILILKSRVIKIKKSDFNILGLLKLIKNVVFGLYDIKKQTKNIKIDLIHSNTTAVFLGAFYSFIFRKKHLWHVHEIVENPKILAKLYPNIVNFFSDIIIFNSNASFQNYYNICPKIKKKSKIIHNGQSRSEPKNDENQILDIKKNLFKAKENDLIIGLIGRIYKRKGQMVLLDSFNNLLSKQSNIHLVFVGCTPAGHEKFVKKFKDKISEYNLNDKVTIVDFQEDIWKIYDSIDISVIPSIEPETFGLVATESMLSNLPVIASNLGGLSEVVVNNETGFLIESNNSNQLEEKMELLINEPELRKIFGENGKKRVEENFSTNKFISEFEKVYKDLFR